MNILRYSSFGIIGGQEVDQRIIVKLNLLNRKNAYLAKSGVNSEAVLLCVCAVDFSFFALRKAISRNLRLLTR